jgi:L-ascorbate metabolism protein UlaG (beta-lactamase superfamily)
MLIRWFGQSAFLLSDDDRRVAIDPFGSMEGLARRGLKFDYPPIEGIAADLLLISHEHRDHSAVEAVEGSPQAIRSTAGTFESPVGEVKAIASEHDPVAGLRRGPNAIFAFELAGALVCHMGDFGQASLRREQSSAIGRPDLLFLPVGGGPTIDGAAAAAIVRELRPRVVIPMHYRTPAVDFLEPVDGFLHALGDAGVITVDGSELHTAELAHGEGPTVVVLAPPLR